MLPRQPVTEPVAGVTVHYPHGPAGAQAETARPAHQLPVEPTYHLLGIKLALDRPVLSLISRQSREG